MIWETVLIGVHVLVAAALVGLVLLQHGKGADMGAAFGSGSSGSLFGAAGSANFLSRTTAILATVFFLSSLGLTYFGATRTGPTDVMKQGVPQTAPPPAAKESKADVPAGVAPAPPAAPAKETGSKPSDVPK
jgi:preprotein translocase subunit SecG